ncbi:MAG: hypothetical protein V1773_18535 [bacterium]
MNMINNKSAKELLLDIQSFSNNRINSHEDIERLFEIVIENNLIDVFNKLLFSSKVITGLLKIIQNSDNKFDESYFNKIKNELKDNTIIVVNCLKEISLHGSNFLNSIFEEKYYLLKSDSLQNLYLLCNDLNFVKMYLNDNRSKIK